MNKIYKVIYNKNKHRYEVVSELAKSHGGKCKTTVATAGDTNWLRRLWMRVRGGVNKSDEDGNPVTMSISRAAMVALMCISVWSAAAVSSSWVEAASTEGELVSVKYDEKTGTIKIVKDPDTDDETILATYAVGGNISSIDPQEETTNPDGTIVKKYPANTIALGQGSKVLQDNTIAIGTDAHAGNASNPNDSKGGTGKIAIGTKTVASGDRSIALGNMSSENNGSYNIVQGSDSIGIGTSTSIFGYSGVSIGRRNIIGVPDSDLVKDGVLTTKSKTKYGENDLGGNSVIVGAYNVAYGNRSNVIGTLSRAMGNNSVAIGSGVQSLSDGAIAIGKGSGYEFEDGSRFKNGEDKTGDYYGRDWELPPEYLALKQVLSNDIEGDKQYKKLSSGREGKYKYENRGTLPKYNNYGAGSSDPGGFIVEGKNALGIGTYTQVRGDSAIGLATGETTADLSDKDKSAYARDMSKIMDMEETLYDAKKALKSGSTSDKATLEANVKTAEESLATAKKNFRKTYLTKYSFVDGDGALGVGRQILAQGDRSMAVGDFAKAISNDAIAYGGQTLANGTNSMAMGGAAHVGTEKDAFNNSMAIGSHTNVQAGNAVALGAFSKVTGTNSLALGFGTQSSTDSNNITYNLVSGHDSTLIGSYGNIAGNNSILIGSSGSIANDRVVGLGNNINIAAADPNDQENNTAGSVFLGDHAGYVKDSKRSRSLGQVDVVGSAGKMELTESLSSTKGALRDYTKDFIYIYMLERQDDGTQIGAPIAVRSDFAGGDSTVGVVSVGSTYEQKFDSLKDIQDYHTKVGSLITVPVDVTVQVTKNGVPLGEQQQTRYFAADSTRDTIYADNTLSEEDKAKVWDTIQKSISSSNTTYTVFETRRIQNVAPGLIGLNSTDAINGSQLFATNQMLGNLVGSLKKTLGDNVTVTEDGQIAINGDIQTLGWIAKAGTVDGSNGTVAYDVDKKTDETEEAYQARIAKLKKDGYIVDASKVMTFKAGKNIGLVQKPGEFSISTIDTPSFKSVELRGETKDVDGSQVTPVTMLDSNGMQVYTETVTPDGDGTTTTKKVSTTVNNEGVTTDGTVKVTNGEDGGDAKDLVTIGKEVNSDAAPGTDGENGTIGLNGKNGSEAVITIDRGTKSLTNDKNIALDPTKPVGETNPMSMDRITYTTKGADGSTINHEVATLDDGFFLTTSKDVKDKKAAAGVKLNDTIKFTDGANTKVSAVTSEKGVHELHIDVSGLPMSYTDNDGDAVTKIGDTYYKSNQVVDGKPIDGATEVPADQVTNNIKLVNTDGTTNIPGTISNVASGIGGKVVDPDHNDSNTFLENVNKVGATTDGISENVVVNAKDLKNLVDTGFKLNTSGQPTDSGATTVKIGETINVVNGANTKVSAIDDTVNGTHTFHIDVTGMPISYTDGEGNALTKIGDNYYKNTDIEDGKPKDNAVAVPADKVTNNVKVVNKDGGTTEQGSIGNVKSVFDSTIGNGGDTGSQIDGINDANKVEKVPGTNQFIKDLTTLKGDTPADKEKLNSVSTVGDLQKVALTPLFFEGDTADGKTGTDGKPHKNTFGRKLSETAKIIGGQTDVTKLTDGNIGVVSNGSDTLTIKLAKELTDLTSVTAGSGDNTTTMTAGGTTTTSKVDDIVKTISTTPNGMTTTEQKVDATGTPTGESKTTMVTPDGVTVTTGTTDGQTTKTALDKDGLATDGKVVVTNGKDGDAGKKLVTIDKVVDANAPAGTDGEHGQIGLDGKNGSEATITIDRGTKSLADGKNIALDPTKPVGENNPMFMDRITYTTKGANGSTINHEVATLDDGLFFAGDSADGVNEKDTTADKNAFGRKLSQQMKIVGGVDLGLQDSATADQRQKAIAGKLTDGNIGVISDGTDTLTVKLAKNLKDLDSATYTSPTTKADDGDATSTMKVDGNGIRFVDDKDTVKTDAPSLTTDGIDAGNKQITNVGSGLKNGDTTISISDLKDPNKVPSTSPVLNNAVNVGDLKNIIDTGFKLNTSGQPTDPGASTVKIGDTINIIDGANTKVSAIDDSTTTGTHTFHIDVTGMPISYTDNQGNALTKIGDNYYKNTDITNGVPNKDAVAVDPEKVTDNIKVINKDGSTTNPGTISNVKSAIDGVVGNGAPNGSTINGEGGTNTFIDNVNRIGADTNGIDKNSVVTTGDLKNLAGTSLFFSGDAADGKNGNVKNTFGRKLSEEAKIVGGVTTPANLTDNNIGVVSNGSDTLTIKLAKQLTGLDSATYTSPTTKADDGDVTSTMKVDGNGIRFVGDKDTVKTDAPSLTTDGIDGGNKQITNVGSGFKNGTTSVTIDNIKNPSDALKNSNVWNNAVNVGDLKNIIDTGFKLNTSGQPADPGASTVKIGDTINIIDGANTKVSAIDDSKTGTYTFHIDVTGLPVTYTAKEGENGQPVDVSKVGDTYQLADGTKLVKYGGKFYKPNQIVNGQPVGDAQGFTINDDIRLVNPNNGTGPVKITNVAPGVGDTDAVNMSQLKTLSAGSKTEVTGTGAAEVTKKTAKDGHDIYNVHVDKLLTVKPVTPGTLMERGADGKYYAPSEIQDKTFVSDGNGGGSWYAKDDVDKYGTPLDGKSPLAQQPKELDQNELKTSVTNPNGTGPTIVDNVKSVLDGSKQFIKDLTGLNPDTDANKLNSVSTVSDLQKVALTPLFFEGDTAEDETTNNAFGRKLSEKAKIVGGQKDVTKLTDNNIGVVSNGSDTLTVKLAKELQDLTSVTTIDETDGTKTIVSGKGVTTDGKVVVNNGKTGDEAKEFVTIDKGTDGSGTDKEYGKIGLDGKNGSNATITIDRGTKSLNDDVNIGVDPSQPVSETNKSTAMDRITYTTTGPNNTVINHEVATLDDGFFLTTSKDVTDNKAAAKVKLNNTIKFTDGANTKVSTVDSKEGVHELHVDVTDLPVTYTASELVDGKPTNTQNVSKVGDTYQLEDGTKLVKVDNKYYTPDQLENGTPKPGVKGLTIDNSIRVINPEQPNSTAKITNVAPGEADTDAVNMSQLKQKVAAATTEVTGTGAAEVTKTTGADGQNIYNVHVDKLMTVKPVDANTDIARGGDGKYYDAKDIAGKTFVPSENKWYNTADVDANTGKPLTGKTPLDNQPTAVDQNTLKNSVVNPNGNGPTVLDNVKSGIGGDAGNNGIPKDSTIDGTTGDNSFIKNLDTVGKAGGIDKNTVVNAGDLKNLADTPLFFTGDSADGVAAADGSDKNTFGRKLSQQMKIVGGIDLGLQDSATADQRKKAIADKLTDGNIGVISDGTDTLTIKLAKELKDLDSVKVSNGKDGKEGKNLVTIGKEVDDKAPDGKDGENGIIGLDGKNGSEAVITIDRGTKSITDEANLGENPSQPVSGTNKSANMDRITYTTKGANGDINHEVATLDDGFMLTTSTDVANSKAPANVKLNNTIKFTDGANTKVSTVDSKDGVHELHIDVTGLPVTYTATKTDAQGNVVGDPVNVSKVGDTYQDAAGNKLIKVGDKYYRPDQLVDSNVPNPEVKDAEKANGLTITDSISLVNNNGKTIPTTLKNVGSGLKDAAGKSTSIDQAVGTNAVNVDDLRTMGKAATTEVTGSGAAEVTKTTGADGQNIYNVHVDKLMTVKPVDANTDIARGGDGKYYNANDIAGKTFVPSENKWYNTADVDENTGKPLKGKTPLDEQPTAVEQNTLKNSVVNPNGNGPTVLDNVKSGIGGAVKDADKQDANTFLENVNKIGKKDGDQPAADAISENIVVNAKDLKNLVDTGFKLNTSGHTGEAQTVKIGDTIKVVDGANTRVSDITPADDGTHTFHIDVTGLPMTYTVSQTSGTDAPVSVSKVGDTYQLADGTKLVKVGDKFYKPSQLVDPNAEQLEVKPEEVAKDWTVNDSISLVNKEGSKNAPTLKNVGSGLKDAAGNATSIDQAVGTNAVNVDDLRTMGKAATTEVTGTGAAEVTKTTGADGQNIYNVHVDKLMTVKPVDANTNIARGGDGKYYNADDIAGKTFVPSENKWYNTADVDANTGKPLTGKTPLDKQPTAVDQNTLKNSVVNPNGNGPTVLDNVKSGIGGEVKDPAHNNKNTFIDNINKVVKKSDDGTVAPGAISEDTVVNAKDLKNVVDTGFKLNTSGHSGDAQTVKIGDTINIIDGANTKVSAIDDSTTGTHTFHIDVTGLPVTYTATKTDANGTPTGEPVDVSKVGDGYQLADGTKLVKAGDKYYTPDQLENGQPKPDEEGLTIKESVSLTQDNSAPATLERVGSGRRNGMDASEKPMDWNTILNPTGENEDKVNTMLTNAANIGDVRDAIKSITDGTSEGAAGGFGLTGNNGDVKQDLGKTITVKGGIENKVDEAGQDLHVPEKSTTDQNTYVNVKDVPNADGQGGTHKEMVVEIAKDLTDLDSVTVGSVDENGNGGTVINKDGMTVKDAIGNNSTSIGTGTIGTSKTDKDGNTSSTNIDGGTITSEKKDKDGNKQSTTIDGSHMTLENKDKDGKLTGPKTEVSNKGITITPVDEDGKPIEGKKVELSDKGLNNGGNQIINVDSGLGSVKLKDATGDMLNNAVNVGDLKEAINNAQTAVDGDGAAEISKSVDDNGRPTYKVHVDKLVEAKADDGKAIVRGSDNKFYYKDESLKQGTDGKWYAPDQLNPDNTPVEGAVGKATTELTVVPQDKLKTSLVNPNGDGATKLDNIKSAIGGEVKDANGNNTFIDNLNNVGKIGADGKPIIGEDAAVTTGDLKNLADTPLYFSGDRAENATGQNKFDRKLSEETKIVGGAKGELSDNNIGVVSNGKDTLTVKLSKDLEDLNTIEVNDSISVGKDGDSTVIKGSETTSSFTEVATGPDGQPLYEVDEKGEVVRDSNGDPVPVTKTSSTTTKGGTVTIKDSNVATGPDGKPLYKVDEKGNPVLDEKGHKIPITESSSTTTKGGITESVVEKAEVDGDKPLIDENGNPITSKSTTTTGGGKLATDVEKVKMVDGKPVTSHETTTIDGSHFESKDKDGNYTTINGSEIKSYDKDTNGTVTIKGDSLTALSKDENGHDKVTKISSDGFKSTATTFERDGNGQLVLDPDTGLPKEITNKTNINADGFTATRTDSEGNEVLKTTMQNGNIAIEKPQPIINPTTGEAYKVLDKNGNWVPAHSYTKISDNGFEIQGINQSGTGISKVRLSSEGLDNGGNRITHVAEGIAPDDAVNVSQLRGLTQNINNDIANVGANAAALAGLKAIQYDPLEPTQIMAAVGTYRGKQAAALGVAHYKNEDTMFHMGVSIGSDHTMANIGVTYKFGRTDEKKAVPDRYKAGPISSTYVLQDEMVALKEENARMRANDEKMNAAYDEILNLVKQLKQDNEEMKKKLEKLEKK